MDRTPEPKWYTYIKNKTAVHGDERYFNGIVEHAFRINRRKEPSWIVLAINGGEKGKVIVATEATTRSSYLEGAFVVVKFREAEIVFSTHDVKPMFDWGLETENFKDWATLKKGQNPFP